VNGNIGVVKFLLDIEHVTIQHCLTQYREAVCQYGPCEALTIKLMICHRATFLLSHAVLLLWKILVLSPLLLCSIVILVGLCSILVLNCICGLFVV
jgi:hypothetical protein